MARPGRIEVAEYARRTGCGAAECVDHFEPGLPPDQRQKRAAVYRVWLGRSDVPRVQRSANAPAGDDETGPARIVVEDRHYEPGRLARVPALERQLARLEATMEAALEQGNIGRVAQLDARISEVRQHLDSARGEVGRLAPLDRNPGAVAEAVEKRQKRIAQLMAAKQAKERDL